MKYAQRVKNLAQFSARDDSRIPTPRRARWHVENREPLILRYLHVGLCAHMEAKWEPRSATPTPPRPPRARRKRSQVPGQRENVSLTHAREAARASS